MAALLVSSGDSVTGITKAPNMSTYMIPQRTT